VTCIVGLEHQGAVYVGSDSAGVDSDILEVRVRADDKVFLQCSGEMIVGFAGSFRLGQLARYSLQLPELPAPGCSDDDAMRYMVTCFVDSLRQALEAGGAARVDHDSGEAELGGELLVGFRGRLFTVLGNYQVSRYADSYAACGAGAQVAMGALFASRFAGTEPEDRVRLALRAASEYNTSIRPPFHIVSIAQCAPRRRRGRRA